MTSSVLTLFHGDTPTWPFTLQENGVGVDLTGLPVTFVVRRDTPQGPVAMSYTKTQGGAGDNEVSFPAGFSQGAVDVTPAAADTAEMDPRRLYSWTALVVDGSDRLSYPRDDLGRPIPGSLVVKYSAVVPARTRDSAVAASLAVANAPTVEVV